MNQQSNDVQSVLFNQNRLFHVLRFSKLLGYEHDDCAKIAKEVSAVCKSGLHHEHSDDINKYALTASKVLEFAEIFAQKVEICLNNPSSFGVSIKWKQTQSEALIAIARDIRLGLIRPACEIPTGIGKTLLEGALLRAYYEACKEWKLECKMLVVTSRVIIADQMVNNNAGDDDLDVGDIALWFQDISHPMLFSLMIGDHLTSKKRENNALITIVSFQGLNEKRLIDICYEKIGFTMVDELHNRTERVSYYLSPINSYCIGMSGTVIGPDMRSPFEFFESTTNESASDVFEYTKHLTYYAPLARCIERGELKPIRWYSTTTKIDIGEVQSGGGLFETFNSNSVEKLLTRDPYLMTKILEEIFLSDYPILEEAGSKHPAFRKTLAGGIPTVKLAKEYVKLYNESIVPKLIQKFGSDRSFKAAYVDGTMSNDVVNKTLRSLRNGEISIIFNCKKIGEGMNEPSIDMILPLGPFGFGSQSTLKQLIGRGLRLWFEDLNNDLLIFDNLFISKKHELTSIFGLLGVKPQYQGELLMAKIDKLNAEHRHLDFVMKGYSFEGAFANMSDDERRFIVYTPGIYAGQKNSSQSDHEITNSGFVCSNLTAEEQFRIDIQHAIWENHDHVIQLAIQSLVRKRLTISLLEGYVSQNNISSFLKSTFVGFKNGKKMIQLVLKLRTEKITRDHLKKFIEVIVAHGFSKNDTSVIQKPKTEAPQKIVVDKPKISKSLFERDGLEILHTASYPIFGNPQAHVNPSPNTPKDAEIEISDYLKNDNPIGNLTTFTLNNFGCEAEYHTTERQYQNLPIFSSVACIEVFGQKIMSDVKVSRTVKAAKKCSAENLLIKLKLMVSSNQVLSYESERFQKILFKANHFLQVNKLAVMYHHKPEGIIAQVDIGSDKITSQLGKFHHEKGAKAFALYDLYLQLVDKELFDHAEVTTSHKQTVTKSAVFDSDIVMDNQSHIVKIYHKGHPDSNVRICILLVYKNGILYQIKGEGVSKEAAYHNAKGNIELISNQQRIVTGIADPISTLHQLCQKHNFTVSYDSSPKGNEFVTTAKATFKIDGKKFACVGNGKAGAKQSSKHVAVLDLLTRIHL